MANIASAKKRARQSEKSRQHNAGLRSKLRSAVKKAKYAGSSDKKAKMSIFRASVATIDSIADKKIIHKNKAARHKSRLNALLKAAS